MLSKFPSAKRGVGYHPTAREWNALNRQSGVTAASTTSDSVVTATGSYQRKEPDRNRLALIELAQDIGPDESSEFINRVGYVCIWMENAQTWVPDMNDPVTVVTEAYRHLIYDKGQRYVCWYDAAFDKWVPVPQITNRHVMTVPNKDGEYPSRDSNPNTYPIAHITTSYKAEAGKQTLDVDIKNSMDRLSPAVPHGGKTDKESDVCGFVHNLAASEGGEIYIPVYSVVPAYMLFGQWYTHIGGGESSESSGSSGSSSSSSDGSSSSVSGTSSSESKTSSSSISHSESSSSEGNYVDVWVGGTFDAATCQFLPCIRRLSWPPGLGITLGEKECADPPVEEEE